MEDFPPISREDPPDVLAHFITQYYHDTGIAITWDMILEGPGQVYKAPRKRKIEASDKSESA